MMSRRRKNHSKHWTIARWTAESKECERGSGMMNETTRLTPRHLLRQWLPSWLLRGQTTSLLMSATEKEVWRGARGGMAQGGRRSSCGGRRGGDNSTQQASRQASKQATAEAEVKRTVEQPHTDRHTRKQASKYPSKHNRRVGRREVELLELAELVGSLVGLLKGLLLLAGCYRASRREEDRGREGPGGELRRSYGRWVWIGCVADRPSWGEQWEVADQSREVALRAHS